MIVINRDSIRVVLSLSMTSTRDSGLGVLAARLLFAFQDELYARFEEAGHGKVTRPHGAVLGHLDLDGTRATELARRSRRPKQVIGRAVDELEQLGYVERRPEPGDRRAKLVVPTERGRELIRLSDRIIRDMERRPEAALGQATYERFKQQLGAVADTLRAD